MPRGLTSQVHLQWVDFGKDDPHVSFVKWEGRTLGGVKYNQTTEAEASWVKTQLMWKLAIWQQGKSACQQEETRRMV